MNRFRICATLFLQILHSNVLALQFGSQQASNIEYIYSYLFARKKLEIYEKFRKKIWTEETFWKIYYSYIYNNAVYKKVKVSRNRPHNNAVYPKETFCKFIDLSIYDTIKVTENTNILYYSAFKNKKKIEFFIPWATIQYTQ
jgi:hypothetical protein